MSRWHIKVSILAAMVVLLLASSGQALSAPQPVKPVPWTYKGFSMVAWWHDDLFRSGAALRQLATTGANTVTFVPLWFMPDISSTTIRRTQQTASDESLIWAINEARALGLNVVIKPQVEVDTGEWRALIKPSDPNAWFANYHALITYYADLAQTHGVRALCVGSELLSMSTNATYEGKWRALIADVRQRFGGALTYSANWGTFEYEEFPRIPFWDALDYLGVSAYFYVSNTNTPTVAGMVQRWDEWRATKLEPFQQQWNKPLIFTEVGYRSVDGAARMPWDYGMPGPLDLAEQQAAWEALFQSWSGTPWFAGGWFWSWSVDSTSAATTTGYEVQNKPAQLTISDWFGGRAVMIPVVLNGN